VTAELLVYRDCCHHFMTMSKSALVYMGQFATGSIQQNCVEFLNEVEGVSKGWQRKFLTLNFYIVMLLSSSDSQLLVETVF